MAAVILFGASFCVRMYVVSRSVGQSVSRAASPGSWGRREQEHQQRQHTDGHSKEFLFFFLEFPTGQKLLAASDDTHRSCLLVVLFSSGCVEPSCLSIGVVFRKPPMRTPSTLPLASSSWQDQDLGGWEKRGSRFIMPLPKPPSLSLSVCLSLPSTFVAQRQIESEYGKRSKEDVLRGKSGALNRNDVHTSSKEKAGCGRMNILISEDLENPLPQGQWKRRLTFHALPLSFCVSACPSKMFRFSRNDGWELLTTFLLLLEVEWEISHLTLKWSNNYLWSDLPNLTNERRLFIAFVVSHVFIYLIASHTLLWGSWKALQPTTGQCFGLFY